MKRSDLMKRLEKLLGTDYVYEDDGSEAFDITTLLDKAAIEIFYNVNEDNDLGQTSYAVRVAMTQLRELGHLEFEKE